jgi:ABC-type transport system involved in multi-copper enzyme maturation permease subunit
MRTWLYVVWLSLGQMARVRLMVLVAAGLLVLTTLLVFLQTYLGRWGWWYDRYPFRGPTYMQYLETLTATGQGLPWSIEAGSIRSAISGAYAATLEASGFNDFSQWIVFVIFVPFLLPLWSLSFGTDALGRERETGTLVWLLSRPVPRAQIYLAKFVALLPWTLGLNLGGFLLICLAAGPPGWQAFGLYWPAVLCGTLAYSSLFHLLGAWVRRPAVVAILYTFSLETLMGQMPYYLKRASISFYTQSMMFAAARDHNVGPENPALYLPVAGSTACITLAALAVCLLLLGMIVFARKEYLESG